MLGALLGELAMQLSINGFEHMDQTPSSPSPSDETTLIDSQITPNQENNPDNGNQENNPDNDNQKNNPDNGNQLNNSYNDNQENNPNNDTDHKPDHEPDHLACNDQNSQPTEMPGSGSCQTCAPLGDDLRDQSPQQK